MDLLLKAGVQLNVAGLDDCGVLHHAALSTQPDSIELLRQVRIKGVDQYMSNNRGETPLAVLDRRIYTPFYEFERGERRPADQEVWAFRQLIAETRKRNAENMGWAQA